MKHRKYATGLSFLLFTALTCNPSHALQLNPGLYDLRDGYEFPGPNSLTIGWAFNLTDASVVNALGVYDSDGDGLVGSFDIDLWDSSKVLLATVSVSGNSNQLASGFRWAEIPSLSLNPGQYVVGALGDLGANLFYSWGTFSTAPNLTYLEDRSDYSPTLIYPSAAHPQQYGDSGLYGANLSFAPASVPAPLPILGLSAALCYSRKLRKSVKTNIPPSATD
jgi:hypothetical protein